MTRTRLLRARERRGRVTYETVVRQAFATVPHYREAWVAAGRPVSDVDPLRATDIDRHLVRLYPLAEPWLGPGDQPPFVDRPSDISAALEDTGHVDGDHIVDLRTSLLDWQSVGRSPYTAAVVPDPADALTGRHLRVRLAEAGRMTLLGDAEMLAAHRDRVGAEHLVNAVVERRALSAFADGAEQAPAVGEAALLHDPYLGYVAHHYGACGSWHVLEELVDARSGSEGLELTGLARRRPTLIRILPEGGRALTVGRCSHGKTTLGRAA